MPQMDDDIGTVDEMVTEDWDIDFDDLERVQSNRSRTQSLAKPIMKVETKPSTPPPFNWQVSQTNYRALRAARTIWKPQLPTLPESDETLSDETSWTQTRLLFQDNSEFKHSNSTRTTARHRNLIPCSDSLTIAPQKSFTNDNQDDGKDNDGDDNRVQQLQAFKAAAQQGCGFFKHKRFGEAHARIVRVNSLTGIIDWGTGSIDLKEAKDIIAGKNTKIFEKVRHREAHPAHCFSIVTPKRTLDLQASSTKVRDFWVQGLRLLKSSFQQKMIEQQRLGQNLSPSDFADLAAKGSVFIKHSSRSLFAHPKVVRMTPDGIIDWGTGSLDLLEPQVIIKGCKLSNADPCVCFQICLPSRTLDLQASSSLERDTWIVGLRSLRESMLEKRKAADSLPSSSLPVSAGMERARPVSTFSVDEGQSLTYAESSKLGRCFVKHCRFGGPHPRIITVDPISGRVNWGTGSLMLRDATRIVPGKNSKIFKKVSDKVALPGNCFSIICPNRSLDLQASSERERNEWVQHLSKLHQRLRPISTDKSIHNEKQTVARSYPQESNWINKDEFLKVSQEGCVFIKHGRRGKPHLRMIKLNIDTGLVDWGTNSLNLTDSLDVMAGKSTETFGRVSYQEADPRHCFSIVNAGRTLDLQAEDEVQRDLWVEGLRYARARLLGYDDSDSESNDMSEGLDDKVIDSKLTGPSQDHQNDSDSPIDNETSWMTRTSRLVLREKEPISSNEGILRGRRRHYRRKSLLQEQEELRRRHTLERCEKAVNGPRSSISMIQNVLTLNPSPQNHQDLPTGAETAPLEFAELTQSEWDTQALDPNFLQDDTRAKKLEQETKKAELAALDDSDFEHGDDNSGASSSGDEVRDVFSLQKEVRVLRSENRALKSEVAELRRMLEHAQVVK